MDNFIADKKFNVVKIASGTDFYLSIIKKRKPIEKRKDRNHS